MNRRVGSTLVEAITVVFLVLLTLAYFFPLVQLLREETLRIQCLDHLVQLGGHTLEFESTNGQLPFYIVSLDETFSIDDFQFAFCWVHLFSYDGCEDITLAMDPAAFAPANVLLDDYGYDGYAGGLAGVDIARPGIKPATVFGAMRNCRRKPSSLLSCFPLHRCQRDEDDCEGSWPARCSAQTYSIRFAEFSGDEPAAYG